LTGIILNSAGFIHSGAASGSRHCAAMALALQAEASAEKIFNNKLHAAFQGLYFYT